MNRAIKFLSNCKLPAWLLVGGVLVGNWGVMLARDGAPEFGVALGALQGVMAWTAGAGISRRWREHKRAGRRR